MDLQSDTFPSARSLRMELLGFRTVPEEYSVTTSKKAPRDFNGLACLTDQLSLEHDRSVSTSDDSDSDSGGEDEHWDRYELIPGELLGLARSPMVKGKGAQIPSEWTTTGNYAVVSRARELVNDVVRLVKDLPDKWEDVIANPGVEEGARPDFTAWAVPDVGFRCPHCDEPI